MLRGFQSSHESLSDDGTIILNSVLSITEDILTWEFSSVFCILDIIINDILELFFFLYFLFFLTLFFLFFYVHVSFTCCIMKKFMFRITYEQKMLKFFNASTLLLLFNRHIAIFWGHCIFMYLYLYIYIYLV